MGSGIYTMPEYEGLRVYSRLLYQLCLPDAADDFLNCRNGFFRWHSRRVEPPLGHCATAHRRMVGRV
jgi:hypothetical protein